MISEKIFNWLAIAVICSLLLPAGCARLDKEAVQPKVEPAKEAPPVAEEPVTLAMKFTEQDSATYRVTTMSERNVKYEGFLPKEGDFKSGSSRNRIEMTFTQEIESVDEKGNAVAKITIKELKCFSGYTENPALDFDSSRDKDEGNALAKLIGQSYTIEITPGGQVSKIIDVSDTKAAVEGDPAAERTASSLFRPNLIEQRHAIGALPDAEKNQLHTGEGWSRIQSFSFEQMGAKSYEKIYTLKEIRDIDGHRIAAVEMNAIPSSEMAEQLHKEESTINISEMFDNTETYTGRLKLDLTAGKIEKYHEKLESEWVYVDSSAGQGDDKGPAILKMRATRLHSLEKID